MWLMWYGEGKANEGRLRCAWDGDRKSSIYLLTYVPHTRQHAQHIQKALVVVIALQRAHRVALGQLFEHFGADERGVEHGRVGAGFGCCCGGHCGFVWRREG